MSNGINQQMNEGRNEQTGEQVNEVEQVSPDSPPISPSLNHSLLVTGQHVFGKAGNSLVRISEHEWRAFDARVIFKIKPLCLTSRFGVGRWEVELFDYFQSRADDYGRISSGG